MNAILAGLGVVNDDEDSLQRRIEEEVESVAKPAVNVTQQNSSRNDVGRFLIDSLMSGDTNREKQKRDEEEIETFPIRKKVKFITDMKDIPYDYDIQATNSRNTSRRDSLRSLNTNILSPHIKSISMVDNTKLAAIISDAKSNLRINEDESVVEQPFEYEYEETHEFPHELTELQQTTEPVESSSDTVSPSVKNKLARLSNTQSPNHTEIVCPICQRSLGISTSNPKSATIVDKHVERCIRRPKTNHTTETETEDQDELIDNLSHTVSIQSRRSCRTKKIPTEPKKSKKTADDEDELFDSDDDFPSPQSNKKRLKGKKKTPATTTISSRTRTRKGKNSVQPPEHTKQSSEEEEEEENSLPVFEKFTDDWEDSVYLRRVKNTPSEGQELLETPFGTKVIKSAWERLHEYQRHGCQWMYDLYLDGVGGILGDEMGLGKTAQMCAHFGSLSTLHQQMDSKESSIFAVICPATVLHHWKQEMQSWAPASLRTVVLHSISQTGAEVSKLGDTGIELVLRKLQRSPRTKGLIVITTYEGLRRHQKSLSRIEWTAVCLDEGQKIRNPSAEISDVCKQLPAFHRLILSGTPIQNSLRELWSLFDFVYPGRLGSLAVFEAEFANPIRLGGYANASKLQYEVAIRCASTLQRIVRPFLLRRKKDDLKDVAKLPPKTEQVLFCQISVRQREIYQRILSSSEVKAVIERRALAFRAINTLRKLCNHPLLVYQNGGILWDQTGEPGKKNTSLEEGEEEMDSLGQLGKDHSGNIIWADSGKLLVLSKVLPLWFHEGHKVLLFSQTRGMLNIMEAMMKTLNFSYLRLDGMTPIGRRAEMVHRFNNDSSIFIMLLTTRTGGVGISLTAANRVILFDPDWNPMTDVQSRERAWRLGQKREVTVYRLITKGTIEEKIYKRQIFKLLLSNRILDNPKQKALFSQSDVKQLFELYDDNGCVGLNTGLESLPKGGAVDLNQEAPQRSAVVTPDDNTRIIKQNETEETNENNETPIIITSEPYVEPSLPLEKGYEEEFETAEQEATDDGSNQRDRRLLRVLFEGEAISSVYDHEFLEPGNKDYNARQNKFLRDQADRKAQAAFKRLESSASVFQCRDDLVASGTSAAPVGEGVTVKNRFGAKSASGNKVASSQSLLAGIRIQQQQMTADNERVTSSSSSAAVSSSSRVRSSTAGENRPSVRKNIEDRLNFLFDRFGANSVNGLKTSFILSKFRDLGDQYAPLFREVLRSVASRDVTNGTWKRNL